MKANG
jgi:hypothetical protein